MELIAHREEDGGIWVESEEMPSFIASAKSEEELPKAIQEVLLLYYEVPRYQAKKSSPVGTSVQFSDGRKITYKDKSRKVHYA